MEDDNKHIGMERTVKAGPRNKATSESWVKTRRAGNFFLRSLPHDRKGNWMVSGLLAGGIVFFILFFFRPFGLSTYPGNMFVVSLIYAGMSFVLTVA